MVSNYIVIIFHVKIFYLQGGSGYARKITFEQIQLSNVKNPIIINQYYRLKKRTQHYDIEVEKVNILL